MCDLDKFNCIAKVYGNLSLFGGVLWNIILQLHTIMGVCYISSVLHDNIQHVHNMSCIVHGRRGEKIGSRVDGPHFKTN